MLQLMEEVRRTENSYLEIGFEFETLKYWFSFGVQSHC